MANCEQAACPRIWRCGAIFSAQIPGCMVTRSYFRCVLDNHRSRKIILFSFRCISYVNLLVRSVVAGSRISHHPGITTSIINTSESSVQIPFMRVVGYPSLLVLTAKVELLEIITKSLLTGTHGRDIVAVRSLGDEKYSKLRLARNALRSLV